MLLSLFLVTRALFQWELFSVDGWGGGHTVPIYRHMYEYICACVDSACDRS